MVVTFYFNIYCKSQCFDNRDTFHKTVTEAFLDYAVGFIQNNICTSDFEKFGQTNYILMGCINIGCMWC